MVTYYTILLLLLLFFSESRESKILVTFCTVVVATSDTLSALLENYYDLGFYHSIIVLETITLLLMTITIKLHKNYQILLVFASSIYLNIFLKYVESDQVFYFVESYYNLLNVLLYEWLLLICVCSTTLVFKLKSTLEVFKYGCVLLKNGNLKTLAPDNQASYLINFMLCHMKQGVFKKNR